MKRYAMSVSLILGLLVLLSCDDESSKNDNVLFIDNFNYTSASPWTPENNWTCSGTGKWNIVAGGVGGNALEYPGTGIFPLINSFTGTDYRVSVRFKPVDMHKGGWPVYLLARVQDDDNWYAAGVYEDSADDTYFYISVNVGGATSNQVEGLFKDGLLDPTVYYTLTIKVEGTTITASCSGGGLEITDSITDTQFSSGMVGLEVWDSVGAYSILFDDFTVTGL